VLAATMTEPRVVMRFLVGPVGCEICGPTMAPDQKTFLVSIQHPGEIDANGQVFAGQRWSAPGARPGSSFPDGGWPRAGVVYVRKDEGGVIGS
jgi:secreted PhoX family phosphatase